METDGEPNAKPPNVSTAPLANAKLRNEPKANLPNKPNAKLPNEPTAKLSTANLPSELYAKLPKYSAHQ